MPFLDRGDVRIHYQESGTGFPLFIIHGGGMDSAITFPRGPFDAVEEFSAEYRCIVMDLRNSNRGQSTGPLETDRPWDMYTDDQLALLDHLGVDRFLVIGFCIGNPLIWNLLKRIPGRVIAAVSAQPSAVDPGRPDLFYERNLAKWGPALCKRRPEIPMKQVEAFLDRMYRNVDFVITASREFVRACQTPLLVLPDDTPSHPHAAAMEMARLAPNSQVSLYPWKETKEDVQLAVRHVREFLRTHCPTAGKAGAGYGVLTAEDRLEIQELIARYNVTEDAGDVDGWAETFTADGTFTGLRAGRTISGREALRAFGHERQKRPGVRQYVHWTSNVTITATPDGARAHCYVMTIEQSESGLRVRSLATRTDELQRDQGRWKFKSRVNAPLPAPDAPR